MDTPVRLVPKGGMDKDTDLTDIRNGNYVDAKNIRHKTTNGNTTNSSQDFLGNEYVYNTTGNTGFWNTQNKRVSIAVNATNNATPTITFRTSTNGAAITTAAITITSGDVDSAITDLVSQSDTAISGAGYGNVTLVERIIDNANFGSVIIEIGGNTDLTEGIDWVVEPESPLTFLSVFQEAIPIGLVRSIPKCIGSIDINQSLFQEWTTQYNAVSTLDIIGASNATPIVILTLTEHGLADGDVVNISGVQVNINANGTWLVNVLTATTFELVGSTGNGDPFVSISGGAEYFSTGLIEITTATPHGFAQSSRIYITGSDASANGVWTIDVTSATTFVLLDSTFIAPFGAGGLAIRIATLTLNPVGLGEIGVSVKNTDNTWTYTRLLRSRELNFRTSSQIDQVGEYNNGLYSIYLTDNLNPPRVFYYEGDFVDDGAISVINEDGRYEYGSITEELSLIITLSNVTISYENQLQSGGSLIAGNKRYVVRGITENLDASGWSALSNPINVYSTNFSSVSDILGNEPGTVTPKANQIRISGINTDFFKFIQVGVVNYDGGGVTGEIIGRYAVPVGGEIVITHYGNEQTTELDLTELVQVSADIGTAKNISLAQNRLLLSNTTSTSTYDLEEWAQQTNYSLLRSPIQGVGSGTAPVFGEYQDPENVFSFTSYMLNETYRFGVKLRNRENGSWTNVYHMIDVSFDDSSATGRRLVTLTNYNLTETPTPPANADDVYVYYIQFENFDWDYLLPNGKSVRQQYDSFQIVRAEVEDPIVLASGILFTGDAIVVPTAANVINYFHQTSNGSAGTFTAPTVTYAEAANSVNRQYGIFYFADNLIGGQTITFQSGDQILTFGQPLFQDIVVTQATADESQAPKLVELYGAYADSFETHNLDGITPLAPDQDVTITATTIRGWYSTNTKVDNDPLTGYAFKINTTFIVDSAGLMANDHGIYQYQYTRPNASPYGDTSLTQYVDTGAQYDIDGTSTINSTYDVYGGDVFNQKNYIRLGLGVATDFGKVYGWYSQNRINSQMRNDTGVTNEFVFPRGAGTGSGNTRIEAVTDSDNNEPFEYNSGYNWENIIQSSIGFDGTVIIATNQPTRIYYSAFDPSGSIPDYYRVIAPLSFYDEAQSYGEMLGMFVLRGELYTLQPRGFIKQYVNNTSEFQATDPNNTVVVGSGNVFSRRGTMISEIGATHKWGQAKGRSLNGTATLYWINTELKKLMRFAADGTQNVSDIFGMRSFLANNLRWADAKDTPADEQGICMAWDARYSQLYVTVRAHRDTSDYSNTQSYSSGNTVLYTPQLYQRNFEQTGEIYKYIASSPSTGNLPTNILFWEKISHDNSDYYNEYTLLYDEDRNTFECFISFKPTIYLTWSDKILTPRPVGDTSRVYEHDRGYYLRWYMDSEETLTTLTKAASSLTCTVSSGALDNFQVGFGVQLSNGVVFFITAITNDTTFTIDDIYLDVDGVVQTDATSISFSGPYTPIPQQMEHGYIEPILNWEPVSSKNFRAIEFSTEIEPYYVNFSTATQVSYLDSQDEDQFTQREGELWCSPIQNESSGGINTADTSRLYGKYLKVKLTFRYLLFQVLEEIIVKCGINQRNFRK